MSKQDARKIIAGLIPDGLDVKRLTPVARREIKDALEVVLLLVEK